MNPNLYKSDILARAAMRRSACRAIGKLRARLAIARGPEAMAALLDDLGERIAAERAKHGIPEPTLIDRQIANLERALAAGWTMDQLYPEETFYECP